MLVDDSLKGVIDASVFTESGTNDDLLSPGETWTYSYGYVVPAGSPDQLVNVATVTANPLGFPNVITDSARWVTNLFAPAIRVEKSGDGLSKIGDSVDYVITVYNDSSPDTPTMYFDIVDAQLGISQQDVAIESGSSTTIRVNDFVIPANAADPYVNTVTVFADFDPNGTGGGLFPNTYEASAQWSTNLFQPSISIEKSGDASSKVGDTANYTITLLNTSSADSPVSYTHLTLPTKA